VAAILAVNNTCDVEGDRAAGRRTLAVLAGRRASAVVVYLLVAAAHGLVIYLGAVPALEAAGRAAPAVPGLPSVAGVAADVFPPAAIAGGVFPPAAIAAGVVSGAVSVRILRRMHRRGYSHASKGAQMQSIARVFVVFTVCLLASLPW
jgi:1,4-dihydroxy-2-naphthoate octaprenyltransferase